MGESLLIKGGEGEIVEKKSRFIATFRAVDSEDEALKFVAEMKKKYWDAKHNCMAYIVGDAKRFSDDGEPSGTAGKPMLDILERKNLVNAVVVVTRYFGGVLLGTGGLVRAYQGAVMEGLKNSILSEKLEGFVLEIKTDYTDYGKIQYLTTTEDVTLMDTDFSDNVILKIVCEKNIAETFISKITETTSARANIVEKKPVIYYKTGEEVVIKD